MSPARADRQPAVWLARAAWFVLPLLVGPALGAALDARSDAVRLVAAVLAWAVWGGVLVALLVPRATSLTALRVGAPAALGAAAWAAGPGAPDDDLARGVLAVVAAAVALAAVLAPAVTDAFVDGSSYGAERRFALRVPLPLVALAALTCAAVVGGALAGPLLLAAGRWLLGVPALVLGLAIAGAGTRSLHGLSRRWLVMVPSGIVVHDPLARPDSVMAPRPLIVRIGPAPAGSDAMDLTLGAPGLALELATSEPLPITVRRPGGDLGTVAATEVLVTPSRPAAVLDEAEARGVPVG